MMLVINSDTIKLCIIIFLIVILFFASCSKMNNEVNGRCMDIETTSCAFREDTNHFYSYFEEVKELS